MRRHIPFFLVILFTLGGILAAQQPQGGPSIGPIPSTSGGGTVTGVTGTAPIVSSGGNAPAISCSSCAVTNGTNNFASPQQFSGAGAASTAGTLLNGTLFTGGNGTTTFPYFYINQGSAPTSFSTGGTPFAINGPSGFAGNFLDFHVNGGNSVFAVTSAGAVVAGGTLSAGASSNLSWFGRSAMSSPADSQIELKNNAGNAFARLQFGGTTSSFGALCTATTVITVCGADGTSTGTLQEAVNSVAFSTTPALDLTKGNVLQYSCTTASSSVVPTISNLSKGIEFTVIFVQNGTTACTWTWPSSIHGAVAVSATLSSISVEKFIVSGNGTDAYLIAATVGTTGGTP
jgi:hypothetical protein